jgi:hypothetical protein
MGKRLVVVILLVGLVAACGDSGGNCGEVGPESVTIDGSAYESPGSDLEVCIEDRVGGGQELCNPPGVSEVSVTWNRETFPKSVNYRVVRTNADGSVEPLVSGTYWLECQPGTVRIELGARPGPG